MKLVLGLSILLAVLWVASSSVLAAQAILPRGERADVHLRSGTPGGTCIAAPADSVSGLVVECDDGAGNRVRGDSFHGCVAVSGGGQCFTGLVPPAHPFASMDVECPDGHSFEITNGEKGGECPTPTYDGSGGVKTAECHDSNGQVVSRVDCTKNGGMGHCDGTKGTGDCTCRDCAKQ